MIYYVQCCHTLVWFPAWQELDIQTNSLLKLGDRAGLPTVGNRRSFPISAEIAGQISGYLDCIVRRLTMFQHFDKVGITGMSTIAVKLHQRLFDLLGIHLFLNG